MSVHVAALVATYRRPHEVGRLLTALAQTPHGLELVVVVDNASSDGTVDILEQFEDRCQVYYNNENVGFAAAQNQAIRLASGEWVLTLNPDVLLLPNVLYYIPRLAATKCLEQAAVLNTVPEEA